MSTAGRGSNQRRRYGYSTGSVSDLRLGGGPDPGDSGRLRSPYCISVLALSLCLCSLIRAQGLEAYLGKPIANVRLVIEGAPRQDAGEELRSLVRVREGGTYSVADV